jgi:hypothetical protein
MYLVQGSEKSEIYLSYRAALLAYIDLVRRNAISAPTSLDALDVNDVACRAGLKCWLRVEHESINCKKEP